MKILIALGGNALLQKQQIASADNLWSNAQLCAQALAVVAKQHTLILCHGNGPQVGLLALQAENYPAVPAYPFDVLVAQTQGMLGYILQQCLQQQTGKLWNTLLTRVEVSPEDSAWQHPSKPIGPVYPKEQLVQLQQQFPQFHYQAEGQGVRRVIASPVPQAIVELDTISVLLAQGNSLICAGGGGIPVVKEAENSYRGVAAVVDKDFTAALLALELNVDSLLILTDVDAVYENFQTPQARAIREIAAKDLNPNQFPAGSMAPKISAACHFVQATGKMAAIGRLDQAQAILAKQAGTRIVPS